jgi:hypothetical protein
MGALHLECDGGVGWNYLSYLMVNCAVGEQALLNIPCPTEATSEVSTVYI